MEREVCSWATADLLDWQSIQSHSDGNHGDSKPPDSGSHELQPGDSMPSTPSARSGRFSIVIEKSCADAIACGEDVSIRILTVFIRP